MAVKDADNVSSHPDPVPSETSHLQPDGTVFPPVTPDPPAPPGYVSPLDGALEVEQPDEDDDTEGPGSGPTS